MYDTWTKCGIYYIGLFACYINEVRQVVDGVKTMVEQPVVTLLSVTPMLNAKDKCVEVQVESEIASRFDAELHVKLFPYNCI